MNQYKYHQKQREESKKLAQIKKDILLEKVKNKKNKRKEDKREECLFFVKDEIARCVEKYMKDEIAQVELYINIKTIYSYSLLVYGIVFNSDFTNKTFGDIINLKKAEWREQQINSILED